MSAHTRHHLRSTAAALLCVALCCTRAAADVTFGDERESFAASGQQSYRTWTIEDATTGQKRTLRQFASRWHATFETSDVTELVFYTSGGFSQDRAADVAEISGLSDVKLKGFYHAAQDQLLFGLGVNLPTGQTNLDDEQVRAANAISPNVLGFRQRRYGEGFDLDLSVAAGRHIGETVTLGGGVSFLHKGPYDLDDTSEYDPGSELALTVGADFQRETVAASGDVVYRLFSKDKLDEADSFEEGAQIELNLRGYLRGERWGLDAWVRDVIKDDNEVLGVPLGTDSRVENGNNLWFGVSPSYQPSDVVAVKGLLDYVAVEQSQQQTTGAWALGIGAGVDVQLRPFAIVEARVQKLTGNSEDDSVDLSGWDGVLALRWQR